LNISGQLQLSGGFSDVTGEVRNLAGGRIIVTGGGTSTFHGPLRNNLGSEFRVSAGSTAVFLSAVQGGGFTGAGTKIFEAGYSALGSVSTPGSTIVQDGATVEAVLIREQSLTVAGQAILTDPAAASSVNLLEILPGAQLDLRTGSLVIRADQPDAAAVLNEVVGWIRSARNTGPAPWTGSGLTSSAAAGNPLTTLAAILNQNPGGAPLHTSFGGIGVDASSVLIEYTWNGDANLDGRVDAADYFRIDRGFLAGGAGFRDGDFDYSGTIDGDDYYLIDQAYQQQSGILAGPAATLAQVPEPELAMLLAAATFILSIGTLRTRRSSPSAGSKAGGA
jgi:hypothetical protein